MININISNHKILSSGALSISVIFLALATWLFTHPKPLSAKPTWNDPEAVWSKILVSQNDAAVKLLTGYLKTDPNSYRGNELAVMLYEMRADRKKTLYHLLRLLSHDHPLNYLYVRKAQSLLTDYNDVWIFAVALESLLKKSQRPRIKSVIRHTLMDLYARLGRWNRVYQLKKKLGWLTEWSIVGPFNNDRQSGFDRAYGPENEILYGKGYRGRLDKLGFRKLVHSNHDGSLPMDSYIYPDNGVVAYGLCYIHSSYARTAYIYAGSTDSLKLWVNDNLALSHRKRKIYAADQYRVKLSLRAGWNKLLWKSARGNKDKGESGDWRVALRLVDADDNPLRGIRITHDIRTNRRYGAIRGGAGQAEMPYQFAIPQTLTSYLSGLPSERRAFYLAMWYRQHQFKEEAVNELEKLRDKWSQNSHYLAILGESYHANDDRGKGQKALKEAIGLDDANFLAHIGLGEYYFRQSMYEKSYASFHKLYKRVGLDIDVYPRLMALYKRKSWDYDALLMAQRAIRQHKTNYLAQLYLANIHRKLGNTREAIIRYQKAIRLNLTHQSARLRLMNLYESKDMDRQAIGQLMALIGLSPAKISYRLGLARLYVKRKRYKLAIKSLSEAAKISPDHPEILKATGDLYYRMGRKSLSLKYYRQALRYAPWDQELREYIHFLSPETVSFMERYAINANEIKDILRKAPPISAHPKSKAVILLKQKLIEVYHNGAYRTRYHFVIRVNNHAGIRSLSSIRLKGKIEKLQKAVTINPDGSESEATVFEKGKISFPSLKVGSVIEYQYTSETKTGEWLEDHFYTRFYMEHSYPMIRGELVLSLPKDKRLKVHMSHDDISQTRTETASEQIYTWRSRNGKAIHRERYRSPFEDLAKQVMLSTIPSWDKIYQWQKSLISDQFRTDTAIKDKVKSLTSGKPALIDKIKAIYYFVSNEIYYLNNDVGIFGKLPNHCVRVFTNGFGDCKDKGTLFIAMLREIGVTAHYAAVRTNDWGKLNKSIPASQTNHIISYIPAQKGIDRAIFADCTSELYPFGYLRPDSQSVWALVFMQDKYQFIKTPAYPSERTQEETAYELSLSDSRNMKVRVRQKAVGHYARQMRLAFKIRKKRREILEKLYNRRIRGAQNLKASFRGLKRLDKPLLLNISFSVKNYVQKKNDKITFPPFHPFNLTTRFSPKKDRDHPMEFLYGRRKIVSQRLKIPSGYKLSHKPEDYSFSYKGLLHYSVKHQMTEGYLQITRELRLEKGIVKTEDYQKLRTLCIQGDRADQRHIILEPLGD